MTLSGVEIPDLNQFHSTCLKTLRKAILNILSKRTFQARNWGAGQSVMVGGEHGYPAIILEPKEQTVVIKYTTGSAGLDGKQEEVFYCDII